MKKYLIKLTGAITIGAAVMVFFSNRVKDDSASIIFRSNVEVHTNTKQSNKEDGALYYAEGYEFMCCGPGNVRSCEGYVTCDF